MFTHPALTASARRIPRRRSLVKTEAARPYGDEEMISSASSSPRMVEIGTTGPNVSSRATSMSAVTRSRTVGS